MDEFTISDKCTINTNRDTDTFVGIICENGDIQVHFPLGYHLSEDDKGLRQDIMLLIHTIGSSKGHKESVLSGNADEYNQTGVPVQAYLSVIYDYYDRGYYRESEAEYHVSRKGKINWSRTIKTQKPVEQDEGMFYLGFVTRRNAVNEKELITLIHEYCVYESFGKMGWLFTDALPQKPRIKQNEKMFLVVLKDKLGRTFNDKNKELFHNMILIIQNLQNEDDKRNYIYGTYRFEYVWEALIDRVYGIEGKKAYFPRAVWKINGEKLDKAFLEPDTIMRRGEEIYVLDAKYYKYGATRLLTDLPQTTSVNKQITYGEYVAKKMAKGAEVYNAFIMPFDCRDKVWNAQVCHAIGEATGDWREGLELYEHIQGILVDVKYLMQITVRNDSTEIDRLADCIEKSAKGE